MSFSQLVGTPQKVTFPAGPFTAGTEGGSLNLPTPSGGYRFRLYECPNLFNAQRDDGMFYGYNMAGLGAQDVAGENSLWFGFEQHFYDGVNHWMEYNLDYIPAAGGASLRFLGFHVNRVTNQPDWAFVVGTGAANFFSITNSIANDNTRTFIFRPNASTRTIEFNLAGGAGELFQFGSDGTAACPDYMSLGPSARVDYKGLSISKQGNVGFGLQALGSGGPVNILSIGNAIITSLGTPVGGGYLYVDTGALKFKGSSGTVTTIAPA